MSFIAKNPLSLPEIKKAPSTPKGTRGLFAKDDGLYEVDSSGNEAKLSTGSDWSQNESSQSDYIKNRTHYIETGVEYMYKEFTLEDTSSETGDSDLIVTFEIPLEEGVEYAYETNYGSGTFVATKNGDMFDNELDINLGEYTGFYAISRQQASFDVGYDVEGYIKITGLVYRPLDEKYIPNSIARKEYVDSYVLDNSLKNLKDGEEGALYMPGSDVHAKKGVSLGAGNIVGVNAYYIKSIDFENKKIYLTKTQPTIPSLTEHEADTSILEDGEFYEVGDTFSIISEFHYPACGTIAEIDENRVITYSEELPFTEVFEDSAYDGNTFNVAEKPFVGCVTLGLRGFGTGTGNIVGGASGVGLGRGGIVLDAYGTTIGYYNRAGYAAIALNALTEALGQHSLTAGQRTKTTPKAKNGVAGGFNTVSNAENQFVFGTFNIIDEEGNFVFILGNGKSDVARSNAFTVDKDGNMWLAGVVRSDKDGICLESDIVKLGSSSKNTVKAEKGICIGNINTIFATANQSIQIGDGNSAAGEKTMQIGTNNSAPKNLGYVYQIGYSNTTNFGQTYMLGKVLEAGEYEQVVQGRYNKVINDAIYVLGNGTATNRKNAFVIKKSNDNAMFIGDIYSKDEKVATEKYVEEKVSSLVEMAPDALDTLEELAKALGNDPNFATTVLNEIGNVKKSIVNPDFSQNDETTLDYIKNRTHYDYLELIAEGITDDDHHVIPIQKPIDIDKYEYVVVVDGEEQKTFIGDNREQEDLVRICDAVSFSDILQYYSESTKPLEITLIPWYESGKTIQLYQKSAKPLDDKYIPDSIARKSDILKTPDWNQNEENAPDYVKNRTHYDIPKVLLGENHLTVEEAQSGDGMISAYFEFVPEIDKEYKYYINGEEGTFVITELPQGDGWEYEIELIIGSTSGMLSRTSADNYLWTVYCGYKEAFDIVLYEGGELKQLDDKYIPESIARASVIGDINNALEEIIKLQDELATPDGDEVSY